MRRNGIVSGRGALAGGVIVIALLLATSIAMTSYAPTLDGGLRGVAEQMWWLVFLGIATAVAGVVAFGDASVPRAASASVIGHVAGVVVALGPATWVGRLNDSIVFPVVVITVVGVSVAAAWVAGRATLRLGLTAAALLTLASVVPIAGSAVALLSIPLLYFVSWTVLPPTVAQGRGEPSGQERAQG